MTSPRRQALVLGRAFFTRLFESDLLPAGVPQAQLAIWSMAVLSAPGLMVAFLFTPKYARLAADPTLLERAIVLDRLLLVTMTIGAMGVAALVIWEGVFPDRRDARILSPLPLRDATQVFARLGALTAFFGMLAVGSAVLPAVLFSAIAAGFSRASDPIRQILAQLATSVAAGAFPFFLLIALQCVLFVLLGRRLAGRVSVGLQAAFALGLLQMLALPGGLGAESGDSVRTALATAAYRLPAVWFAGLFDVLAGRADAGATRMAWTATGASILAVAATFVLYVASFRTLTRQALETPGGRQRPPSSDPGGTRRSRVFAGRRSEPGLAARRWHDGISRTLWGLPVERAVCGFTLRTLVRSRQHRMLMAVYVSAALGIVLLGTAPAIARGASVARPGPALGSATGVLIFVLAVALRSLFALPVEPKASWAIRVREPHSRQQVVNGVRRALFAAGVLPAVLLTGGLLAGFWGAAAAARHSLLWLALGLLLVEFLMAEYCRIPFTCPGLPGRGALRLWPWYYVGFVLYAYGISAAEFGPLRSDAGLAVFLILTGAAFFTLTGRRSRALAERDGLEFSDEDPRAMFEGFGLSEGLARRN